MIKNLIILLLFFSLNLGCSSTNNSPISTQNTLSKSDTEPIYSQPSSTPPLVVSGDLLFQGELKSFQMTLVNDLPTEVDDIVVNADGEFQIYVSCRPLCSMFFQDLKSDEIYVLTSTHLDGRRGYKDIEWIDERTFEFTLVTQPNYGVHYVIDVIEQKIIRLQPQQY